MESKGRDGKKKLSVKERKIDGRIRGGEKTEK